MRRFPVHPAPSKGTCTPVRTSTSRPCMRWRATGMPVWTSCCPCWTLCPSTWTYQLCMQCLIPPCCIRWLPETISQPCSACWTGGPKLPNLRIGSPTPCYMTLQNTAAWKCCSSWCSDGRRASDKQTAGAGGLCSSQLKMGAWKPCACCGRRGRSHRRLSYLISISMITCHILIAARSSKLAATARPLPRRGKMLPRSFTAAILCAAGRIIRPRHQGTRLQVALCGGFHVQLSSPSLDIQSFNFLKKGLSRH